MLVGSTTSHYSRHADDMHDDVQGALVNNDGDLEADGYEGQDKLGVEEHSVRDAGPDGGPQSLSSITLAARPGENFLLNVLFLRLISPYFKNEDTQLALYLKEPEFPYQFKLFLYSHRHPNRPIPDDIATCVKFTGKINVFHLAVTRFYAPSDLCGAEGMYHQHIQSNPS